jgi:hypothetical protein
MGFLLFLLGVGAQVVALIYATVLGARVARPEALTQPEARKSVGILSVVAVFGVAEIILYGAAFSWRLHAPA